MMYFCTLFDSYYLTRGLAMYESLSEQTQEFHLYMFAFDDTSEKILRQLRLKHVTVISLEEFETPELLAVKPGRTKGEYCWTCTPFVIRHCLNAFDLPHCTYIDADLYFFNDPKVLLNEMASQSVLITAHRYTPRYDQSATSGIYCVQFITFMRDEKGRKVLDWWGERCLEWCYNRLEDGKFGDQKYLDDWPTRFEGVHELVHEGGGVAPWNVQQYRLLPGTPWKLSTQDGRTIPLIFYHFHWVRQLDRQRIDLGYYDLNNPGVMEAYSKMLLHLFALEVQLKTQFGFDFQPPQLSGWKRLKEILISWRRRFNGTLNIISRKQLGWRG